MSESASETANETVSLREFESAIARKSNHKNDSESMSESDNDIESGMRLRVRVTGCLRVRVSKRLRA